MLKLDLPQASLETRIWVKRKSVLQQNVNLARWMINVYGDWSSLSTINLPRPHYPQTSSVRATCVHYLRLPRFHSVQIWIGLLTFTSRV